VNKKQKVLITAAIAGLFAVPGFAKQKKSAPADKSTMKTQEECEVAGGTWAKDSNKCTEASCGANGCGSKVEPSAAPKADEPVKK